jgi:hypothetical protein
VGAVFCRGGAYDGRGSQGSMANPLLRGRLGKWQAQDSRPASGLGTLPAEPPGLLGSTRAWASRRSPISMIAVSRQQNSDIWVLQSKRHFTGPSAPRRVSISQGRRSNRPNPQCGRSVEGPGGSSLRKRSRDRTRRVPWRAEHFGAVLAGGDRFSRRSRSHVSAVATPWAL